MYLGFSRGGPCQVEVGADSAVGKTETYERNGVSVGLGACGQARQGRPCLIGSYFGR
jgi:hypothetical protein